LAAYGIVLSTDGLLATQFSDQTAVAGRWGLPGGGIRSGETAAEAAVREIYEETGQQVTIRRVLDLQSDRWIGPSPTGVIEDFHALRLIYVAETATPVPPVVHDTGGTTADARWVPLHHWRRVRWSTSFRHILSAHLDLIIQLRDLAGLN
jgi:8-oxo-dGTP pyrophosphatase MutT (NUDIX family)